MRAELTDLEVAEAKTCRTAFHFIAHSQEFAGKTAKMVELICQWLGDSGERCRVFVKECITRHDVVTYALEARDQVSSVPFEIG